MTITINIAQNGEYVVEDAIAKAYIEDHLLVFRTIEELQVWIAKRLQKNVAR